MPNKNKIKKLENYDNDASLAMFEEVQELTENTEEIAKTFKGMKMSDLDTIKGEKGDTIKGEKGDTGDKPTPAELLKIIKPLIPKPIKGSDGKDADINDIVEQVLQQVPAVDKKEIVNLVTKQLPTSGEAIRDSLELLQDDDKLDISAIKGIEKELKTIKKDIKNKSNNIIPPSARDFFDDIDLSLQLDGVTKTFQIKAVWNILSVSMSSRPNVLRKNVDFTYTPTSIEFTDEINASTSLAAGQTVVLTVVLS